MIVLTTSHGFIDGWVLIIGGLGESIGYWGISRRVLSIISY